MTPVPDTSIATKIQECAVAHLQAGAEFSGVPILGRRVTNIENDIEQAINELGGACIYIPPGLPRRFTLGAGAPYADRYELRVRVIENVTLNQTLPPSQVLVEYVMRRLWGLAWPEAITGMNPLVPIEGEPVAEQPDPERLIFDVIWETSFGYMPRVES